MPSWMQGFCLGATLTTVAILIICICAVIYHSGTISQAEEKQEQ